MNGNADRSTGRLRWAGGVLVALAVGFSGFAQPPGSPSSPPPQQDAVPLSLGEAVRFALEHNPELQAQRQQHGIAAAAILIAQTYPFNPSIESKVRAASGPESAGITNTVDMEYLVFTEIECRGQGRYRREVAAAALSRTDWEIIHQELGLSVRVVRAFDTVIYRYQKRRLVQQNLEYNQRIARQVEELVKVGTFKPADQFAIRSEVQATQAQLQTSQLALTVAYADLRRALGVVEERFQLDGDLTLPTIPEDGQILSQAALDRRADLRARRAAVLEADARTALEIANRYGNVNVGPSFALDPSRVSMIGAQFTIPLPLLNTHRGEIMLREAERAQAALVVRQTEIGVQQDVHAALARLQQARTVADAYRKEILPDLERNLNGIRELFEKREPGVDLLRVVDVQRKLLTARDAELDAQYELRQALADLTAAVGDARLALGLWSASQDATCPPR